MRVTTEAWQTKKHRLQYMQHAALLHVFKRIAAVARSFSESVKITFYETQPRYSIDQ